MYPFQWKATLCKTVFLVFLTSFSKGPNDLGRSFLPSGCELFSVREAPQKLGEKTSGSERCPYKLVESFSQTIPLHLRLKSQSDLSKPAKNN